MTTKSAFSIVGLAHKVCLSAEKAGYNPTLLNELAEHPDLFRQLRQVQLGYATTIKPILHIIDCDADPYVPEGWEVVEHQRGGQFTWGPSRVMPYYSLQQKRGESLWGDELCKELKGKPVLNANVLDYLLANRHLIPEKLKEKMNGHTFILFFWGTIYRLPNTNLQVRGLGWSEGQWGEYSHWLGGSFRKDSPAALRVS